MARAILLVCLLLGVCGCTDTTPAGARRVSTAGVAPSPDADAHAATRPPRKIATH